MNNTCADALSWCSIDKLAHVSGRLPAFAGFFAVALTGQAIGRADGFGTKHALPTGIAGAFKAHVTPESENHNVKCLSIYRLELITVTRDRSKQGSVSRYAEIMLARLPKVKAKRS